MACLRAVLALGLAFALAAESSAAPLTVIDGTGEAVTLPAPARRIVSLAPSATELLFAAGAGNRVVAVTDPADFPLEAAQRPRVGDARSLDLERIVASSPDLAVAWPYVAPVQIERLRALGIPVYRTDPHTPEAIALDIERLGMLAGTATAANATALRFRSRLAALRQREEGARAIRVFYEIWDQPLYTIGGTHLISAAIHLCGGQNVFAGLVLPAPSVSVEAVLAARPAVIIAGTDGAVRPAWLDAWRRWTDLPAVMRDNLFVVDANLLHRAGPRFVDGAEALCAVIDRARANAAP
ncbi:MAG TPA: cobalamin-binding protein [Casimicrobiaceae bacterium]|jgi:iron complex transport system substrate-binding protein